MRRLVVSSVPGELRAALLDEDVPIELYLLREDEPPLVGGIFRGRVARSLPALNGAFVEIGTARPAFLPGRAPPPEGSSIIVQVIRDGFAGKGPEVRRHALPSAPEGGIGRLDAPGSPVKQLFDRFRGRFDLVVFDRQSNIPEARRYVDQTEVEYDAAPDFDARTGLADAFDEAIAGTLPLAGGGQIHVDSGAAFTAIDVDLGAAADTARNAGDAILATNLAAADMIARQLRLRQIGGPIVVDFISMARKDHRLRVEAALGAAVASDPSPVQIHGWTRLGHLELTRQRGMRPIADDLLAPLGLRLKSPVTTGWDVLRALDRSPFQPGGWRVRLHPQVAAALSGRLGRYLDRVIAVQHGMSVELDVDAGMATDSFDIRPLRS